MKHTIVLGINAVHDAAVCVLVDGELVGAVAEERLSRQKHHRGFPRLALEYCLHAAGGRGLRDVSVIVLNESVNTDYALMLRHEADFTGDLIVNPSHHLLHAYYAVTASRLCRPVVLVLDGSGYSYGEHERRGSPLLGPAPPYSEMEETQSIFQVDADGELTLVDKQWGLWQASEPFTRFPSLGHMYSAASEYIFGSLDHAGKTMGLAPYGDAAHFPDPIVTYGTDGLTIDTEWITRLPPRSDQPPSTTTCVETWRPRCRPSLSRQ
jgi:carbamoyltransferase